MVDSGGYPSVCGSNLWRTTTLTFCSRPFLGDRIPSERQLWHLFHQFGASTRALAEDAVVPDRYLGHLEEYIDEIQPNDLLHIFQNPGSSKNSHYLITIYPQEGRRHASQKTFASRRVFNMVWEKHIFNRVDLMEEFHYLFMASPIAAAPAGWVFENRMHQLLRRNQTLRLFPILPNCARTKVIFDDYAASKAKNTPTEFQLTDSMEHPLVWGAELQTNHCCRPESSNFAAVDSVLLIRPPDEPPILFMFQMTRNETKRDINLRGLRKVDRLVVPLGTRRYLVIVTPENVHPAITVPLGFFGGMADTQSEETDRANERRDEEMYVDQDEETDEDQDEEADDQGDVAGRWALFRVFHCPINMSKVFIHDHIRSWLR